ncbi:hypothetical protein PENTCL1PPCAC_7655, partial [Pristionchus entomophagus]
MDGMETMVDDELNENFLNLGRGKRDRSLAPLLRIKQEKDDQPSSSKGKLSSRKDRTVTVKKTPSVPNKIIPPLKKTSAPRLGFIPQLAPRIASSSGNAVSPAIPSPHIIELKDMMNRVMKTQSEQGQLLMTMFENIPIKTPS